MKAVCLVSGGLDSALAARLIQEQRIEVVGVNFVLPFESSGKARKRSAAGQVAECLGIDLRVVQLGEAYLEVIEHPAHGYGSNANPCVDCHIFMLKLAKEMMEELGARFVVTGEVLGQRPMSQRLDMLRKIEKESGLKGLVLRPLSAKLLEATIPEQEGWVERDRLLAISGRSRKELLRLAGEKGVVGFSSPAGGCLLTDPAFALKVRDLIDHGMLTLHDIRRLTAGRHFRLPKGSKLIVGRNQSENEELMSGALPDEQVMTTPDVPGPAAVLIDPGAAGETLLAASIVARYSDGRDAGGVKVEISGPEGRAVVEVAPLAPESVKVMMI
jgi:tRNA U34 2-thiouridine synthase MnmA/TrmU